MDVGTALPKAELHLHIEGTLEPELMFSLARRNGITLPFGSVEEARAAYRFTDLQSFLDLYYRGASVLVEEQDFYDLAWAYFDRASQDGVRRAEIFFDPQTHTARGVPFATVVGGLGGAARDATALGVDAALIMCFLRHHSEAEAMDTLAAAADHVDDLLGIGLDSSEVGHPPRRFRNVYAAAGDMGLRLVAHAGEEGPPEYIWEALDVLGASRIDHGVRCLEDATLVQRLVDEQTPLTVCPLSNVALRVVARIEDHPLGRMLAAGLNVSIHSDDPAYFGGYIGDNYRAAAEALGLDAATVARLAANSIDSAFLQESERASLFG